LNEHTHGWRHTDHKYSVWIPGFCQSPLCHSAGGVLCLHRPNLDPALTHFINLAWSTFCGHPARTSVSASPVSRRLE
ncbi:hypothetical protein RB213_003019, partial [Colletotrichum asianum]